MIDLIKIVPKLLFLVSESRFVYSVMSMLYNVIQEKSSESREV